MQHYWIDFVNTNKKGDSNIIMKSLYIPIVRKIIVIATCVEQNT